jgi:hypothetical protein
VRHVPVETIRRWAFRERGEHIGGHKYESCEHKWAGVTTGIFDSNIIGEQISGSTKRSNGFMSVVDGVPYLKTPASFHWLRLRARNLSTISRTNSKTLLQIAHRASRKLGYKTSQETRWIVKKAHFFVRKFAN